MAMLRCETACRGSLASLRSRSARPRRTHGWRSRRTCAGSCTSRSRRQRTRRTCCSARTSRAYRCRLRCRLLYHRVYHHRCHHHRRHHWCCWVPRTARPRRRTSPPHRSPRWRNHRTSFGSGTSHTQPPRTPGTSSVWRKSRSCPCLPRTRAAVPAASSSQATRRRRPTTGAVVPAGSASCLRGPRSADVGAKNWPSKMPSSATRGKKHRTALSK